MVVVGDDGRIDLVNLRAEELFGYTRAELTGQDLEVLIPERLRPGHRAHLSRFFANPGSRPMGSGLELFGRRKDGTELPIEVSLSPLRTDGQITVSAAIRDISDRKHTEAVSRLNAERLVSAVESIQDAFALFDRWANKFVDETGDFSDPPAEALFREAEFVAHTADLLADTVTRLESVMPNIRNKLLERLSPPAASSSGRRSTT